MTSDDPELNRTARTTLRRKRERGGRERRRIYDVLDAGLVAHVGFVGDAGPLVLPMAYVRLDDVVYLHGAPGNAMLRHLAAGARVCLTVTLLDGLVFARAAFHHSMNYRSAVLFGTVSRVTDPDEVRRAAAALLDHLAPGRGSDARPPTDAEVQSTLLVRFPIVEGSVKVRTGGPVDEPDDLGLPVWAGVLPLATVASPPVADGGDGSPPVPGYLRGHRLRP